MSFQIETCSECNETYEDEFKNCLDCGKTTICSYCIRTLSQDGNSYYGCMDCYDKETKYIEKRKLIRRQTFTDSVRLSCVYRGVSSDPSMIELNTLLDDYCKNGTMYINKEIFIVNNDIVYRSIAGNKYKMVINLYNNLCWSDTFNMVCIELK